ncbi:MAG: EF-P lysine aminoacylase GenX [Methylococcaceae bacterium]|nr:EF-P lysine aminoacylase GenX [Methylococcaceae bacterium]
MAWRPTCDFAALQLRAKLLAATREFFAFRSVLEVETPLLAPTTGTDPQLAFFETHYDCGLEQRTLYLQTSPEFAMKRLLAAGSGSIYQIGKAFRNGEVGRFHNPEFTLLEWYRVGFDLPQLMVEVAQLFDCWFAPYRPLLPTQTISYSEVFKRHTGLDALCFDFETYAAYAVAQQLADAVRLCGHEHSVWLDFLFSHQVQPHLGSKHLEMVYAYPACQASLARLNPQDARVAERVELFLQGVELGNGFFELTDAQEQEQRFENEQQLRQQKNLPSATKDLKFLAALQSGLPSCAGIAIGLDRVLMLLSENKSIDDVLSFSQNRI